MPKQPPLLGPWPWAKFGFFFCRRQKKILYNILAAKPPKKLPFFATKKLTEFQPNNEPAYLAENSKSKTTKHLITLQIHKFTKTNFSRVGWCTLLLKMLDFFCQGSVSWKIKTHDFTPWNYATKNTRKKVNLGPWTFNLEKFWNFFSGFWWGKK